MNWTERDDRDFYELMQTYRHTPLSEQAATIRAFEDVKAFIDSKTQPRDSVSRRADEFEQLYRNKNEQLMRFSRRLDQARDMLMIAERALEGVAKGLTVSKLNPTGRYDSASGENTLIKVETLVTPETETARRALEEIARMRENEKT